MSTPATPDVGLVTEDQLTEGRWIASGAPREVVVNVAYANTKSLKLGSSIPINGNDYTVVGLVRPTLTGSTADIYFPLATLQELAGKQGRVTQILVKADKSTSVDAVAAAIKTALPGAEVVTTKALADQVTGSLADARGLANRLGGALAGIVLLAAFAFAAVLTLSSIAKRVREIGTLRAIGWSKGRVVRQLLGETMGIGLIGGVLGIGAGVRGRRRREGVVAVAERNDLRRARYGRLVAVAVLRAGDVFAPDHEGRPRRSAPTIDTRPRCGLRPASAVCSPAWSVHSAPPDSHLPCPCGTSADRINMSTLEAIAPEAIVTNVLYELRDVRRVYRTGAGEVAALNGVDLQIMPGEFLAIEGPSGSGKSTLLQLLGALDRPTSGSLHFDNRELAGLDDRALTGLRANDIGFVFQSFNLIPTLTAAENVEAAMITVQSDRKVRRARALELLEPRRSERSGQAPSLAVVRWRAAARGHCPSTGQRTAA